MFVKLSLKFLHKVCIFIDTILHEIDKYKFFINFVSNRVKVFNNNITTYLVVCSDSIVINKTYIIIEIIPALITLTQYLQRC